MKLLDPFEFEGRLKDVQLNDSEEQKMGIDSSADSGDFSALLLFFLVIISLAATAFFSPETENIKIHTFEYINIPILKTHKFIDVSLRSRYLKVYAGFIRTNTTDQLMVVNGSNCQYKLSIPTKSTHITVEGRLGNITFKPNQNESDYSYLTTVRYPLNGDGVINFNFSLDNSITKCNIKYVTINQYHAFYQFLSRTIFIIVSLVTLIIFIIRMRSISYEEWTMEQTLICIMHGVIIIGFNPTYYFYYDNPTKTLGIVDNALYSLVIAYTIYMIFRVIRVDTIGPLFAIWHFIINFFIEADLEKFWLVRVCVNLVTLIIFFMCNKYDSEEKLRYIVYSVIFGTTITCLILSDVIKIITIVSNTAVTYSLKYTSIFSLGVILTYFYWPYENPSDFYEQPDENGLSDENIFDIDEAVPTEIRMESDTADASEINSSASEVDNGNTENDDKDPENP